MLRIETQIESDPFAALVLGPIECGIGPPNERGNVLCAAFICHHADADCHLHGSFFEPDIEFFESLKYALGHPLRLLLPGPWQQGAKLVTSPSADKILIAQIAAQRGSDGTEYGIACLVPMPVVDLLEMVDIEHRDRESHPGSRGSGDLAEGDFLECPAVIKAGQRIAQSLDHEIPVQSL